MYLDVRTYFRFMYLSIFRSREVRTRLGARRAAGLVFFFLFFPLFELFTAACLLLDHVFFPGFRRVRLERPLFIVGHPRSGTTYLHQLIAGDEEQFVGIKVWEALFPSILQKKVLAWVGRVDARTGGRLKAGILRREEKRTAAYKDIHEMGLFKLAEDDRLFLHTFSSHGLLWLLHPCEPGWQFYFDERAGERDRERVLRFYRACLQRQVYFRGGNRTVVMKSPLAALRVRSLRQAFPDCRMIYTVRNPLEAVPSMISFGRRFRDLDPGIANGAEQERWLYEGVRAMYLHPLACFKDMDSSTWDIIVHENLRARVGATVRQAYAKFGYQMSASFSARLEREEAKQKEFRSKHVTTPEQFGLSRAQIAEDFREVFTRCGFAP